MPNRIPNGATGVLQQQAYGTLDLEAFHRDVRANAAFTVTAQACGEAAAYALCAVSVLSDVQELVDVGRPVQAKLEINKAKFLLAQIIEPSRKRGVA